MSGKNQRYSKELKLKAVKMYMQDGLSAIQIAKELELSDSGRVYKWVAIKEISNCGLTAIDAIINVKNFEIEKSKIDFKLKIDIPDLSMFNESDLSVLLGCIIDNAIESNKKLNEDKRFIDLYITFSENYLMITCVNANDKKIVIPKNGLIASTKTDKKNHGYGLISIKNICEKYNGRLNIESDEEKFIAKCILFVS